MASSFCLGLWFHITTQILNNKYVPLLRERGLIWKNKREKEWYWSSWYHHHLGGENLFSLSTHQINRMKYLSSEVSTFADWIWVFVFVCGTGNLNQSFTHTRKAFYQWPTSPGLFIFILRQESQPQTFNSPASASWVTGL